MTFVDTSALYALVDLDDENHGLAKSILVRLLRERSHLFTTNYVVLEASALVQNRFGFDVLTDLHERVLPFIEIRWVDARLHHQAVVGLFAARRRKLSMVDCSSFATMRAEG